MTVDYNMEGESHWYDLVKLGDEERDGAERNSEVSG